MFERFTDRARSSVVLAQQEAKGLGHDSVGTEHILLGLLRKRGGVATRALDSLQISSDEVRREVEDLVGRGESHPVGHIPFTPQAKQVLVLAFRETQDLGTNYIGTEHLLLGLIREGEGIAAAVLLKLGADLERTRGAVLQLLTGSSTPISERDEGVERFDLRGAGSGARCPSCHFPLEGALAYRPVLAERADADGDPISVTLLYCMNCGCTVGIRKA